MSKIRENYVSNDTITWLQVHNLLPIIGIIIAAVGVFNLLQNKVEIQNQRIDYLNENMSSLIQRTGALEDKFNQQSLDIKELQTRGSVKGASIYTPNTGSGKVENP